MTTRVLIAEDSQLLGALLSDALRAHARVDVAEHLTGGEKLLDRYRALLSDGEKVHLLVLDIHLPGLTGLDVGRRARRLEGEKQVRAAPIVFFSSRTEDAEIHQALVDCFPARFVHKVDDAGPAKVAMEGALLIGSLLGQVR